MDTAVLCVGAYILDILGRPVSSLPDSQNSVPIEEIRITAAGTAGGTSVDLARLGMKVLAAGAVGNDTAGEMLLTLLRREHVDVDSVTIKDGPTSSTILPVRPDGTRTAWHVQGANSQFGPGDLPYEKLAECAFLHVGGVTALPSFDGAPCVELLRVADDGGCFVTADCLGVKRPDALELLEQYLPYVDVFLPNDEESLLITGAPDVQTAAAQFASMGADAVIITMGSEGSVVWSSGQIAHLPAYDVPVIDATGCGDAFSAGVIAAFAHGLDLGSAAEWGTAAAALTAQSLGSDGGDLTLNKLTAQLEAGIRKGNI